MAQATTTAPASDAAPADVDLAPGKSPSARFRFENVSASIFPQQVKTKAGKEMTVYSVSLQRSYRDADGKTQYTNSLNRGDLLPAAYALLKAYEHVSGTPVGDDK